MTDNVSVITSLFTQTGQQMLSEGLRTSQKRVRVAAAKALLVAEAPAARAAQEVRKAGSKTETIEPKASGNINGGSRTLAEMIDAVQLDAAEKVEHLLARHMKQPPGKADTFGAWAKMVHERHDNGSKKGISKRQLCRDYSCHMRLIDRALGYHAKKLAA